MNVTFYNIKESNESIIAFVESIIAQLESSHCFESVLEKIIVCGTKTFVHYWDKGNEVYGHSFIYLKNNIMVDYFELIQPGLTVERNQMHLCLFDTNVKKPIVKFKTMVDDMESGKIIIDQQLYSLDDEVIYVFTTEESAVM